jgi:replication factor C subunit 1
MDAYYINKEDFDTVLELGLGKLSGLMADVPTNVKSAFTRK